MDLKKNLFRTSDSVYIIDLDKICSAVLGAYLVERINEPVRVHIYFNVTLDNGRDVEIEGLEDCLAFYSAWSGSRDTDFIIDEFISIMNDASEADKLELTKYEKAVLSQKGISVVN